MSFFKCVLVGAPLSGKTSLIDRFMSGTFENSSSNVLTTYNVNMIYKIDSIRKDLKEFGFKANLSDTEENKNYNLKIYEYNVDRSSSECLAENELNNVDVVILCYRIDSEESKSFLINNVLTCVNSQWPNAPCVLVSCCCDLEKTVDDNLVKKLNPKRHYVCSSKNNTMVNEMFVDSFKIAVLNHLAKKERLINYLDDWVVCEPKTRLDRQLLEFNSSRMNENFKIVKAWKSASRFIVSFVAFGCLCMYFVSIQYCIRNKSHCDEIYELSKEAFNESISALNESYLGLVHQIKKF